MHPAIQRVRGFSVEVKLSECEAAENKNVWYLYMVTSDNFIRPSSTFIPKTFSAVAGNVSETVQRAFVEVQYVASFLAGAGVSGTG